MACATFTTANNKMFIGFMTGVAPTLLDGILQLSPSGMRVCGVTREMCINGEFPVDQNEKAKTTVTIIPSTRTEVFAGVDLKLLLSWLRRSAKRGLITIKITDTLIICTTTRATKNADHVCSTLTLTRLKLDSAVPVDNIESLYGRGYLLPSSTMDMMVKSHHIEHSMCSIDVDDDTNTLCIKSLNDRFDNATLVSMLHDGLEPVILNTAVTKNPKSTARPVSYKTHTLVRTIKCATTFPFVTIAIAEGTPLLLRYSKTKNPDSIKIMFQLMSIEELEVVSREETRLLADEKRADMAQNREAITEKIKVATIKRKARKKKRALSKKKQKTESAMVVDVDDNEPKWCLDVDEQAWMAQIRRV